MRNPVLQNCKGLLCLWHSSFTPFVAHVTATAICISLSSKKGMVVKFHMFHVIKRKCYIKMKLKETYNFMSMSLSLSLWWGGGLLLTPYDPPCPCWPQSNTHFINILKFLKNKKWTNRQSAPNFSNRFPNVTSLPSQEPRGERQRTETKAGPANPCYRFQLEPQAVKVRIAFTF